MGRSAGRPWKLIKVYSEIGYGNPSLISSEIEYSDGSELRLPGFKKMHIEGVYFRLWFRNSVFILSSRDGFKIQLKNKKKLKILFGLQGRYAKV